MHKEAAFANALRNQALKCFPKKKKKKRPAINPYRKLTSRQYQTKFFSGWPCWLLMGEVSMHAVCSLPDMWQVKRFSVFEHSVITNFNCTCPAIQRGQGSGFLSVFLLTHCLYERAVEVLARLQMRRLA